MCLFFCKKYKRCKDTKLIDYHIDNLGEEEECSICLEIFKQKDKILILPCYHFFHQECILKWSKRNNDILLCPYCN